jgi:uncharacterized protein YaiE (UPF0345 family)
MDKEEAIEKLSKRWPNAKALREEFSGISALLAGEFNDNFNVYERPYSKYGIVVSRPLVQGLEKNPTIGLIEPGYYSFEIGENIEIMTVLEGKLYTPGKTKSMALEKYGSIMAPAGTTLVLDVELEDSHAFYLCQYKLNK